MRDAVSVREHVYPCCFLSNYVSFHHNGESLERKSVNGGTNAFLHNAYHAFDFRDIFVRCDDIHENVEVFEEGSFQALEFFVCVYGVDDESPCFLNCMNVF